MIGIVDLNVPGAKASERINELAQCMQFLNDLAPERHACLLEVAEYAKRSSRRGISDEEREVEEALWSLRQVLDVRWVMPFNLHPSAEQQSNRRQLGVKIKHCFSCLSGSNWAKQEGSKYFFLSLQISFQKNLWPS